MLSNKFFLLVSIVFLLFSFLMYSSCGEDDPEPTTIQLLLNLDMESGTNSPYYWGWFSVPPEAEDDFKHTWTDGEYYSPTKSLEISSDIPYDSTFSSWVQTVRNIPHNKDVKLTVKIKGINLEGEGVSIAIRADDTTIPSLLQFETTQDRIEIKGTFDWTTYSIEMENILDDVNLIYIFLLYHPNTTGTVYFDDATLTYAYESQ